MRDRCSKGGKYPAGAFSDFSVCPSGASEPWNGIVESRDFLRGSFELIQSRSFRTCRSPRRLRDGNEDPWGPSQSQTTPR